jgi:hypothetical protein
MIVLSRQARDKYRERTPKKHAVYLQGVPESLAMEQAKRVVAAVGANPKPWWTGPEDSKGMFLQVCDCLSRACLGKRISVSHR